MTTRRRHYILCTYGEEQQSEFMYTRLIRCIQLVRHGTQHCADDNSRPVRPATVQCTSLIVADRGRSGKFTQTYR